MKGSDYPVNPGDIVNISYIHSSPDVTWNTTEEENALYSLIVIGTFLQPAIPFLRHLPVNIHEYLVYRR